MYCLDAQTTFKASLAKTNSSKSNHLKQSDDNSFHSIVELSLHTLIQSDVNKLDGSSSQGRWMDAHSGELLTRTLNRLVMNVCLP
jgi:hypothetical protein